MAAEPHSVIDGWRLWYTRPAEEQLTLYSPVYGTRLQGFDPTNCRTATRVMRAVCSLLSSTEDPVTSQRTWGRHAPPAPGCRCGIYAVTNVVDAIYRLRAMTANIRRGDAYNSWFPYQPDRGMVPVLARVRLHQAVEHDDVGTWSILSRVQQQIGVSTPVVRAASAEITQLFVTGELIGAAAADRLAQRLAVSFGVATVGGGYPVCTEADWESRPDWMRSEPWRTWYAVDEMLTDVGGPCRRDRAVEPLHVVFVCTNNYVRSPMAALMFAHQIRERGLADRVRVSSAGMFDDPRLGAARVGAGIAEWAGRVLRSHGYPTAHRGTKLTADHLGADLVIAADSNHVRKLAGLGVPADRLRLLRSFDPAAGTDLDIEDPKYNYQIEQVYNAIVASLPGLHGWASARLAMHPVRGSSAGR